MTKLTGRRQPLVLNQQPLNRRVQADCYAAVFWAVTRTVA
jgi:hypothetical protein